MLSKIILGIGFLLFIVTAMNSHGFHHADEHFQIIEFANAKMGKSSTSELAWEYEARIRPTIQPTIGSIIFACSEFLGVKNPYWQATILRLLTALVAFSTILFLINTVLSEKLIQNRLFFLFCTLFIGFMPYLNVRFSSETWSGLFFLIPFTLLLKKDFKSINPFLIGGLLGLSFLFRYQVAFMVFGLFLWLFLIQKTKIKTVSKMITAFLGIVLMGIFIDSWFYGDFTFSAWNYFVVNIVDNKASEFGVEPWYFYFEESLKVLSKPFGFLLIAVLILFFIYFKKHLLTWVMIPFLLVHFLIPHKEFRFLFPLVNLLPIAFILVLDKITSAESYIHKPSLKYITISVLAVFIISNTVIVYALSIESAGIGRVEISRHIHNQYGNQNVKLLNTPWASPYKPWGAPINHYYDDNVENRTIENPMFLHDSLFRNNKLNMLIVRNIDLNGNPNSINLLKEYNSKILVESFNPLTKFLGSHFGFFNTDNNLILYKWEKKGDTFENKNPEVNLLQGSCSRR